MGTAVLTGVLDSTRESRGTTPFSRFIATTKTESSAERLRIELIEHRNRLDIHHGDNEEAFRKADVIILGCKPYMAEEILRFRNRERTLEALKGKLIISLVAASPPAKLFKYIYGYDIHNDGVDTKDPCYITSANPSIAATVRESSTTVLTPHPLLPKHFVDMTHWIFSQVGRVYYVQPELYDVGCIVGGATGAFMAVAIEGLLDGAVAEGIKRSDARAILAQSLIGLGKLMESGELPSEIQEKCSSPRGLTIRGLLALEAGGVRPAFSKAVMESTERARQLQN
ncbi:hypothetical protein MMC19_004307 [Ptychographa xylographoides]|nr:hypothetical protein [Ptychographa xylographoides]